MDQIMIKTEGPATIVDGAGFNSLVNTLKYADVWEKFDLIYNTKRDVPERLHGFTIVCSDDPAEPYGVLLQMAPPCANTTPRVAYTGQKLLAKVRLH
ncbi:MAG: hypothetical protein AAFX89_06285 [Pseudomonadota bacterium]